MIVFKLSSFILLIAVCHCRSPDKVSCVNEQCSEPISKARTVMKYTSADRELISFRGNAEAVIYMKSAGSHPDLWYAEIDGNLGFVNKMFLKEYKIINRNPSVIVPIVDRNTVVQPDKVQQAHEVFEGTTLYTTESGDNYNDPATTQPPIDVSSDSSTPPLSEAAQAVENTVTENTPIIDSPPTEIQPKTTASESSQNINNEANTVETASINQENADQLQISPTEIPVYKDSKKNYVEEEDNSLEVDNSSENIDEDIEVTTEIIPIVETKATTPEMLPIPEPLSSPDNVNVQDATDKSQPIENNDELNSSVPLSVGNTESNIKMSNAASTVPDNINSVVEPPNPVLAQESLKNAAFGSLFDLNSKVIDANALNTVETLEKLSTDNFDNKEIKIHFDEKVGASVKNPVEDINGGQTTIETVPADSITIPTATIPAIPVNENSLYQGTQKPLANHEVPAPTGETHLANQFESEGVTQSNPTLFSPEVEILTTTPSVPEDVTQATPPTTPPSLPEDMTKSTTPPSLPEDTSSPIPFPSEDSIHTQTTPTPNYLHSESTENTQSTTEPSVDYPVDTGSNQDETPGILSNMFTTLADLWPTTTEAPATSESTENSFNYGSTPPPLPEENKSVEEESFSFMKHLMATYYSVLGVSDETKALFPSVGETCFTDEYCDGTASQKNRLLTFLITAAISVLIFTLGYYYIDNWRQDGQLIGKINALQRDLLFATKECDILKEELATTKTKLAGIEDNSFGMDDMVQSLKEEINELNATNERLRQSLDTNEKLLRVSENTASEMQNTLGEVENTLSELLAERANSEEQIAELNGKIQAFEEELIEVSRERDNFQLKFASAENASEESKKQKKLLDELNEKLTEANSTIDLQKHELVALKDAMKDLKTGGSNVDVASLIDHTEIKAKLSKALEERKQYSCKYEAESKEKARMSEELKTAQETLVNTTQQATEASTRLEVLGKYFQERESELLKELSAKESLWLSKQGESASAVEKMELLQQEVQRFKEKCDALTLELAEQESSRRAAVSALESRTHSAWLEARSARRDADAAKDEAAALRRKLAQIANADGAVSPHRQVSSPLEGAVPPPLPLGFLPPPLLPPLPRPPPLGRLPSPHPPRYGERRYSPDSRYSPETRYSPESRYSPGTARYSPDSRYSPQRRVAYSPRRRRSRERYESGRGSRSRPAPPDTETEYNSDSPTRRPRRSHRYSGPSSGSGCSSESDK